MNKTATRCELKWPLTNGITDSAFLRGHLTSFTGAVAPLMTRISETDKNSDI